MTQARFVRSIAAATAAVTLLLGAGVALAGDDAPAAGEAAAPAEIRTPHQYVYIVYLNPADRECLSGYQERLDRVMSDVQQWYADEMKRNGFGPMTFPLERDENGKLVIHVVKGTRSYAFGETISTQEVRDNQVKAAMRDKGIDIDQEHIIIFQNVNFFTDKDGGLSVRCWAPYCGLGDNKSGTAYVTDFELFDTPNLAKKSPKVDIGGDGDSVWTLSRYVVSHMGGVAHEFGHALSLPHNAETDEQREELGYALMGHGNYHLFAERAGEEHGAHLTKKHATVLSSHPLFKRNTKDIDVEAECRFFDVEFAQGEGEYVVTGRVEATPPAYAVIAYHDGFERAMDYDATSWVADFDEKSGRFEIHVGALKAGEYELRLRCLSVNNERHGLNYQFTLGGSLAIPVRKLNRQTVYELYAKPAIAAQDADALLAAVETLGGFNDIHYRRARAYHRLMTRPATVPKSLSDLPETVRDVSLSSVKWASAEVGWDEPTRGSIPVEDAEGNRIDWPLESGEQLHERGLYAHANSSYVFDLDGKWKRFTSGYGLQNFCKGSAYFVVKCDGEERFRSTLMTDWVEGLVNVDLSGVKQLELIVEDVGDGVYGDCAIWFSPMLTR